MPTVPALEEITGRLGVTEDVAGATFMAAGGSAPELATSLIGTFVSTNDVGVGTIVGSAVFNVLFVIGMCAIFSKEVLKLTWWPLARDSSFYSIFLLVLVYAFYDKSISVYEAFALFICYIIYVTFMKYNQRAEYYIKTRFFGMPKKKKKQSFVDEQGNVIERVVSLDRIDTTDIMEEHEQKEREHPELYNNRHKRLSFHMGTQYLMFHESDPLGKGEEQKKDKRFKRAAQMVIMNNLEKKEQVRNRRGTLEDLNAAAKAGDLDDVTEAELAAAAEEKKKNRKEKSEKEKRAAKLTSEPGDKVADVTFDAAETNVAAVKKKKGESTDVDLDENPLHSGQSNVQLVDGKPSSATEDDSIAESSSDYVEYDADAATDPLHWPSSWSGRLIYICLMPLTYPLYVTIPNVTIEGKEHLYPVSFFMSIVWIAIYSYLMVWWATICGEIFNIPPNLMGLIFLSAGTSVPDLLTSVLVARKGFGDMAVSSSIGSNIFDICVGLPIPWIIKTLIDGKALEVGSDGLFFSIVLLFGMLVSIILIIKWQDWKMTKTLGYLMFVLYGLFIAQSLIYEYKDSIF